MMKWANLIIFLLLANSLFAQENDSTQIEDETIDIIKDYEPVVKRANKKHFAPKAPEIKIDKAASQTYNLPTKYEVVEYKPSELRPLSYPKEGDTELPFVYLKAGFGNYLTPLLDFQVANKKTDRFRVGLGVEHVSANRKKLANQRFGETHAQVIGEYYTKGGVTFGMQPYFHYDAYNFYGYNHEDTTFASDATKINYRKGGFELYTFNHEENTIGIDYNGSFKFNFTKDSYSNRENNVHAKVGLSKTFINILKVGGNLMFDVSALNGFNNETRVAGGLNPFIEAGKDRWQVRGGMWLLVDEGDVHFQPDIKLQFKLYKDFIVMYNEWVGHLEINNMHSLSQQVPWLARDIDYQNYRVEARNFIGLKGNVPIGLDYDVRFSQMVYYNRPLFVNDNSVFNKFDLSYDAKLKAWNGHAAIGYQFADFLKIRTSFDYFNYNTESLSNPEAWHLPNFKTSVSATYHFNNKLILKASLFAFSGVKVRNTDGNIEKLKPLVDLNFSAQYQLNKYVGFFAQVNNVASQKSQQFYKYPGYGFLALGGVILSY